jgi:hypothetical protein
VMDTVMTHSNCEGSTSTLQSTPASATFHSMVMNESDLFLSALEIPGRPAEAWPPQSTPNLAPAAPEASPSAAVDTPQQTTAQGVPTDSGASTAATPDSNTQKHTVAPVDTTEEMDDSQQEFMVTHTEVTQAKQELRQAAVDAKPEKMPMVSHSSQSRVLTSCTLQGPGLFGMLLTASMERSKHQPSATSSEPDSDPGCAAENAASEQAVWTPAHAHKDEMASQMMASCQPDDWVPDHAADHCRGCGTGFGALARRHHCRRCGELFCYYCCNSFVSNISQDVSSAFPTEDGTRWWCQKAFSEVLAAYASGCVQERGVRVCARCSEKLTVDANPSGTL